MTENTPKYSLIIFVCLLISFNITYAQLSVYEIPLSNQIALSSQIVEGEVVSKTSYWNDKQTKIYTAYKIEVAKVFKGTVNPYINIITDGGVIGLEAQIVSHSLDLSNGEMGLFIVSNDTKSNVSIDNDLPKFKMVSANQGFYKYNLDSDKVINTFSVRDGIISNFYEEIKNYTREPVREIQTNKFVSSPRNSELRNSTNTAVQLTNFSTTSNSAGTNSVLTITGSGFGTTKGSVEFSNANYGGYIYFDALDNQILDWTDSRIEVEIPYLAGTGTVKVNTISNGTIESSENLQIDFAQINLETNLGDGNKAYQTQHIDKNLNGGYTWIMNSDFNNTQNAKDAFQRAFDNWTCSSGVNWTIDSDNTTTINSAQQDGENVITFDSGLSSGVLGRSTSYYSGCLEGSEVKWYVTEIDIVFNPGKLWNYTVNEPQYNEIDFESVTLHELGHAHQLGHVVDTNEVMHYSLSNGVSKRELSNKDLAGAYDIHQRSKDVPICSQDPMTNSICFESNLSNDEIDMLNEVTVYPNPSKEKFFINNKTQLPINGIQVYNIVGGLVLNNSGINLIQDKVELSIYNKGIYIVKIVSDNATLTKKLIIH